MCCIAEIAMMVFGIVTLVKGKFTLSRDRVVTGTPAYIIGIILTGTLPLIVGVAFVIGVVYGYMNAVNGNTRQMDLSKFAIIDFVAVPLMLLIVMIIAWAAPKSDPREQIAPPVNYPPNYPANLPPMGDNPYASPQSDQQYPQK